MLKFSETLLYKLGGGLTYLPPWKNETNYVHGIKL